MFIDEFRIQKESKALMVNIADLADSDAADAFQTLIYSNIFKKRLYALLHIPILTHRKTVGQMKEKMKSQGNR